jgi:hypothetical protein
MNRFGQSLFVLIVQAAAGDTRQGELRSMAIASL